jgi:hypothetical protein
MSRCHRRWILTELRPSLRRARLLRRNERMRWLFNVDLTVKRATLRFFRRAMEAPSLKDEVFPVIAYHGPGSDLARKHPGLIFAFSTPRVPDKLSAFAQQPVDAARPS